MSEIAQRVGFRIWGPDDVVYGPVELSVLVSWVKEERVIADTWVFSENGDCWRKASRVPELVMFFGPNRNGASGIRNESATGDEGVSEETAVFARKPGSLRRVKIFAEFSDEELSRFVKFMQVQRVKQYTEIVKQGQHGDAMYFLLEGELRVRLMVDRKETTLVTLGTGDFFGEISLFDQGPRSADVIANTDSLLMRISIDSFRELISQAPELAAPFLFAMGKTLTARIRADNKRYRDSIQFARSAGERR